MDEVQGTGGETSFFSKGGSPRYRYFNLDLAMIIVSFNQPNQKKAPVVEQEIWNPQVSRVDNHGIDSSKLRAVPSQLIVLPGLK